jgi:hypothetical protein
LIRQLVGILFATSAIVIWVIQTYRATGTNAHDVRIQLEATLGKA